MKKTLLKVKNNITFEDKLNAIDLILGAFWDDNTGEYIPWMEEPARIIAVAKYFIEGYELEKGENLYKLYLSDDDLKGLVDNFINPDTDSRNGSYKRYIKVMDFVDEMVHDKLEWTKQNIIHAHPDMERIVKGVNVFIDAFENLANLDLTALTPEMIENGVSFMEKLKESGFEINAENFTKIVKDAAAFNIDKASQDIIDAKNDQIKKLQEENKELKKEKGNFSARNVMNDGSSNKNNNKTGTKVTKMDKKK
jgi:hypothetical protein|nr:MAG TPA: hypothetical protein [Caudoviricetes sp.]